MPSKLGIVLLAVFLCGPGLTFCLFKPLGLVKDVFSRSARMSRFSIRRPGLRAGACVFNAATPNDFQELLSWRFDLVEFRDLNPCSIETNRER